MANTGNKEYITLLKVVDGGPNNGQALDINNNLCSATGLPQATKPNVIGQPDYVPPFQDLIDCPLTVVPMTIAWSNTPKAEPYTNVGFFVTRNGTEVFRGDFSGSGTISGLFSGDSVQVFQFKYFNWRNPSDATHTLLVTDGATIFNGTVPAADPMNTDTQNTGVFVLNSTKTYSIASSSNSEDTTLSTHTFNLINSGLYPADTLQVVIDDSTNDISMFSVINAATSELKSYSFNVINDGNPIIVKLASYSGVVGVTTEGSSPGVTDTRNVVNGTIETLYIVPKGSITVTTIAVLFYSQLYSESATKNDCPAYYSGSTVTTTANPSDFTSTSSQGDADQQAVDWVQSNKQANANANGFCSPTNTYYSTAYAESATKDNCPAGSTAGTSITTTANASQFSSIISQEDANNQAINFVQTNKQANANANGSCTSATTYFSTVYSESATRNNCPTYYSGGIVTLTASAGQFTSIISQEEANNQAINWVQANKQDSANASGVCSPTNTFFSAVYSESATKNNCPTYYSGSSVTLSSVASQFTSIISQLDANNQAIAWVQANKQSNANSNGACSPTNTFFSATYTESATRNNCPVGSTGGTSISTTSSAGQFSSIISQQDANNQAIAWVQSNKQANANASGACIWQNTAQSANFTRNNCGADATGTTVTFTIPANIYSSQVSQAAANQPAINDLNAGGQNHANTNGVCVVSAWYNVVTSGTFTRNNCGPDATGTTITYTVPAGTHRSTISQADANQLAINNVSANGQTNANNNGVCVTSAWYNVTTSGTFTRNNCGPDATGTAITYTVPAGTHRSTISQANANQLAINNVNANGQTNANNNGVCVVSAWYNISTSGTFTKNNCGVDQSGTTVTYTVPAGTHRSTISQADANQLAINNVNANGQTNANNNGSCFVSTWRSAAYSESATKNNCPSGFTGTTVTLTANASQFSSTISQAHANQQAINFVQANKQTHANNNGSCIGNTFNLSYALTEAQNPFIDADIFYDINGVNAAIFFAGTGTFAAKSGDSVFITANVGGAWNQNTQVRLTIFKNGSVITNQFTATQTNLGFNLGVVNSNDTYFIEVVTTSSPVIVYNSAVYSESATKNDCPAGSTGNSYTLTANLGQFTSTISQADANQQAITWVQVNKQNEANANVGCSATSVSVTGNAYILGGGEDSAYVFGEVVLSGPLTTSINVTLVYDESPTIGVTSMNVFVPAGQIYASGTAFLFDETASVTYLYISNVTPNPAGGVTITY